MVFSTRRLKDDEIDNLVSGACAGFVGYPADCENNLHTGRSSEKAARYAWAGKPFVAVASPSFEEVVREYRCGVTITSVQELTQAVRQIESDYDTYCRGALVARDACYDFRRSYRPFGNWLESLRGQRVTR